jgi:hypothetical protein
MSLKDKGATIMPHLLAGFFVCKTERIVICKAN